MTLVWIFVFHFFFIRGFFFLFGCWRHILIAIMMIISRKPEGPIATGNQQQSVFFQWLCFLNVVEIFFVIIFILYIYYFFINSADSASKWRFIIKHLLAFTNVFDWQISILAPVLNVSVCTQGRQIQCHRAAVGISQDEGCKHVFFCFATPYRSRGFCLCEWFGRRIETHFLLPDRKRL